MTTKYEILKRRRVNRTRKKARLKRQAEARYQARKAR